ncbi:MAG: terpene cyclase/mutase family protein [Bryobacterales bacterium]|nr:terpene cyclase/mutase family protein [Bryobacterales bacterium]
MGGLYLESRLDFIRENQNPDGGWGYFPGKVSWFEPTTYAMLALDGAGSERALDRAWKLLRSWQTPEGSFQPNAQVKEGTWVTAHAVTLACVQGVDDGNVRRAVDWLLKVVGAEHSIPMRTFSMLHLLQTKLDVSHEGWPWREGNASWIEPTVHTLVALKKVANTYRRAEIAYRIREGEKLVLSRRCSDGGWNCGNPNVLNYDLPSYPETTGLAMIGLSRVDDQTVGLARRFCAETKSSLAKAWLQIALRCHRQDMDPPQEIPFASRDVMLASLEALGHSQGNYRLFGTGAQV